MGHGGSGGLERRTLDVAGVRRTYWLARGPDARPERADAAAYRAARIGDVRPGRGDDLHRAGYQGAGGRGDGGVPRRLGGRVARGGGACPASRTSMTPPFCGPCVLRLQGTAEPRPVVLAGISNGAGFAEHVGRHGLLPLAGLFLVAGTIREASRQAVPVPRAAGRGDDDGRHRRHDERSLRGRPAARRGVIGPGCCGGAAARHGDLPSQRRDRPGGDGGQGLGGGQRHHRRARLRRVCPARTPIRRSSG